MESLQETMAALQEAMNNMMTQLVNAELEALKNGERTSTNRGSHMNNTHYGRMTKIEFPRFNGDDVKGWMYRCKQFFKIDGIEEERKVELASMHILGRPIVDLKNLKQEGSVHEAFETLLNRVELNEAYDVSLFIGGLKKELSMPIKMFKISNLTDVYAMAKMQEATNAVLNPRYNSPLLPTPKIVPNSTFVNKTVNTPFKSANMNGGNQIMSRNGGNRSHRLTGKEFTIPLQISIANGQNMMSCYECKNFQWSLQGETFTSDVMLLPFGGCEIVLGIQWLATLGDIQCNFQHLTNVTWNAERSGTKSRNGNAVRGSLKFGTSEGRLISIAGRLAFPVTMTMKFVYNGRRMVLRGTKNTTIHWMQRKSGNKDDQIRQTELSSMVLCVYPVNLWQMEGTTNFNKEVDRVLANFERVFEIPIELPPQRSHDHQIPLMPNTPPINIRP
ncbi:hypothetical protein Tco_0133361 [Tanacetum coccineum]